MPGSSVALDRGWLLPARLEGRALLIARLAWLTSVSALVALAAVGSARVFSDPALVALGPTTEVFSSVGVNLRIVAVVVSVTPLAVVVVISGLVFWRRSHDPMALLFTLTLLLFCMISSRILIAYEGVPVLRHSATVVFGLSFVGLALVLAVFPDGRLVPRSARWLPPAAVGFVVTFPDAIWLAEQILQGDTGLSGRALAMAAAALLVVLLGLAAQVYRYQRVSGATERQQAKWVMGPLGVLMALVVVTMALVVAFPAAVERWLGWVILASLALIVLLPVGVANAVLRYRLYEIDRIISRTVSYSIIVAVLAGVYGFGVVVLGVAVSGFGGARRSDLVVAASVLAVAALFRPVRTRVQAAVDRRFNRTSFEARLVVDSFVHRLREQVEFEAIRRELAAAAAAAVQPAQLVLWLAGPERKGRETSAQADRNSPKG